MLKKIPSILSPELVKTLMDMGHSDEIIIADGNFPAASHANKLIRCDGLKIPELLRSILELLPLDAYVEKPISLMEVTDSDFYPPEIWNTYKEILVNSDEKSAGICYMERFSFYERSKKAYAVVTTSETALYANILLKKGVIE